jgi:hypothetical protein
LTLHFIIGLSKGEVTLAVLWQTHMDQQTKTTLWIASAVLISYFVWFYLDCAMHDACRIVCRRGCHTEWTPDPK